MTRPSDKNDCVLNLATDPWIPVRRKDGSRVLMEPWRITETISDNPVVAVDTSRADLDAAITEFLIGLFTCAIRPKDGREWRDLWHEPPKPEYLRRRLYEVEDYFKLGGDGPRFMQDRLLAGDAGSRKWKIAKLVLESPGEITEKNNSDIFEKREAYDGFGLCAPCAAAAIYNLQAHAPCGGVGHRVSIRGGSPLTTIIKGPDLWSTVWANVMEAWDIGVTGKELPERIYPWLRTAPPNGELRSADYPKTHAFWGMPRRILLDLEGMSEGICSICGAAARVVTHLLTKSHGLDYAEGWIHPLTPYRLFKDGLFARPAKGGIGYPHWLGLVEDDEHEGRPAEVVSRWKERHPDDYEFRIWAFGYEADNAKIRRWVEGQMPLVTSPMEHKKDFSALVVAAVKIADWGKKCLVEAVRLARFGDAPKKDPRPLAVLKSSLDSFWAQTEAGFYMLLRRAAEANPVDHMDMKAKWLAVVKASAIEIFKASAPFRASRAEWTARAFHRMNRKLSIKDPMMLKIIDPYNTGKADV